MNKLQECQLEILKAFIKVCKDNNLQYYLVGGTCLGAVRHKGFIPWDDDIDVGMPRKDYDKFITLQKEFKDPYFIQTYKTDDNYVYNYAKVRDSSTTFIENFFVLNEINHGVWIDVFPIDGMSKEIMPAPTFKKKVMYTWHQAWLMFPHSLKRKVTLKNAWKSIPLNLISFLFCFLNLKHYRNRMVDKKVTKLNYDECKLVGNFFGTNPTKEAMPKEIFEEGSMGVFEGIPVSLPKDPDKYLTLLFGDYMKLPPVEQQVGHHYDKGLSLEESYITYRKKHHQ